MELVLQCVISHSFMGFLYVGDLFPMAVSPARLDYELQEGRGWLSPRAYHDAWQAAR